MAAFITRWTPFEDATLRRLYAQYPPLTAKQIGRVMGKTRNAVLGRAHRMDLYKGGFSRKFLKAPPRKITGDVLRAAAAKYLAEKPREVTGRLKYYFETGIPASEVAAPPAVTKRVPDMSLKLSKAGTEPPPPPARDTTGALFTPANVGSRHCRFPYNHPGDAGFHYCGHTGKSPQRPWCEFHQKIVYEPPRVQPRAARR